jgi:purine-binding chemotaxis protein CheW
VKRARAERVVDRPNDAAVLATRAAALARPVEAPSVQDALEVLVLMSGRERYAVPTAHLLGVSRLAALAPLPGAPAAVAGLIAWRGRLLRLLDLRVQLGLPAPALEDRGWVAVAEADGIVAGLLCGRVEGPLPLALEGLRAMPGAAARGPGVVRGVIRGVTADATILLDLPALLRDSLTPDTAP